MRGIEAPGQNYNRGRTMDQALSLSKTPRPNDTFFTAYPDQTLLNLSAMAYQPTVFSLAF